MTIPKPLRVLLTGATVMVASTLVSPGGSAAPTQTPVTPVTWGEMIPDNTVEAPPPLQALEVIDTVYFDEIAVPDDTVVTGVDLLPDGEHWLLGVEIDGAGHLAVTLPDGSDYRCITCGVADSAEKPEVLDDEQRVWFANTSGQTSGAVADYQWSVLECLPSVYDCQHQELSSVDFPIDSLTSLPQGAQNREATPDGEGRFVVWNEVRSLEGTRVTVGRIERGADGYRVTDPRVLQPQFSTKGGTADWVAGGRFYEGGRFVLGNRYVKYQTTRTALNYDTGLLDLATGEYRFMTRDLDYNETGDESPDGQWFTYSSARGLDRMDVFTQLVRPSLIDMVAFGQVGRVGLFSNRRCMNEAWLMGFDGQRQDGYAGQPLLTEDNWLARKRQWYPDSRTLLLTEQLLPNVAGEVPRGRQFRLRTVRLPGPATAPLPTLSLDDVDWDAVSVPAAEYRGLASRSNAAKVLRGRVSGRAVLTYLGTFAGGSWTVRYRNYSDDGVNVVNGRESIRVPLAAGVAVWTAILSSTGARRGTTKGRLLIQPDGASPGNVTTTINGRTWTGVPKQADCPGMRQPELDVAITAGAGRSRVVAVSAIVAEDSGPRPVAGAVVAVGPHRYLTNQAGLATVPSNVTGAVQVDAGGFRGWSQD
ncbi:hypothetical protein [Nocardioides stalactiti]|uniref:hypothetical protein n=1 Tax=Nocardioides stalactiti TaxID=2755356 RepID=UPI001602F342|nr:hypothetical protein [Nocardioides stalactiti]